MCADFARRHYLAGRGSAGQDASAVEALLGQTSHRLYSTWGAARNHTNQWPVDAHVWRQLHLSAVARFSDIYRIYIVRHKIDKIGNTDLAFKYLLLLYAYDPS